MEQKEDDNPICCDVRLYDNLPLATIMLQGWFSDQHDCFQAFLQELTADERSCLFDGEALLDSIKAKYKRMWDDGAFRKIADDDRGVHKLTGQLKYSWFSYWAACVSRATSYAGGLEMLINNLHTVESAHDGFRRWFYRTKKVRNLNAADTARLLARYEYLEPEERPLLARGALRGAAILLNTEPRWKKIKRLEDEYQDPAKRIAIEENAARYIDDCPELARFGRWRMEEGENWFCNVVHKEWFPA